MRIFLLLFVLIVACGTKKKNTVLPEVVSQELQDEINRITPLLLWCDGGPTGDAAHDIDGRPKCNLGDNPAEIGFLTIAGNFSNEHSMFEVLKQSFAPDGRPLRSPSYITQGTNTFSRDQLLGFAEATVAGFPVADGLARIMDYYNRTGEMCANSDACRITPGMNILVKYAMGKSVTTAEKIVEASETLIEAQTVPMNFRAGLVTKKIYTMARMGRLTTTHAKAAKIIYDKAPHNLWFRTVYGVTHNGNQAFFEAIASSLVECMKLWQKPGTDWTFSKGDTQCFTGEAGVYGHELVALGHLLLNVQPVAPVEDNSKEVENFIQK